MARDLNQIIEKYKQSSLRYNTTINSIIEKYGRQDEEELESVLNLSEFKVVKDKKGKLQELEKFGKYNLVSDNYQDTSRLTTYRPDVSLYGAGAGDVSLRTEDLFKVNLDYGEEEPSDAETLSSNSSDSEDTFYSDLEEEVTDGAQLSNQSATDSSCSLQEQAPGTKTESDVDDTDGKVDEADDGYIGYEEYANSDTSDQLQAGRLGETFVVERNCITDRHLFTSNTDRNHSNNHSNKYEPEMEEKQKCATQHIMKNQQKIEKNNEKTRLKQKSDSKVKCRKALIHPKEINNNSVGDYSNIVSDKDESAFESIDARQIVPGLTWRYRDNCIDWNQTDKKRVSTQYSPFKQDHLGDRQPVVSNQNNKECRNKVTFGSETSNKKNQINCFQNFPKQDKLQQPCVPHKNNLTPNRKLIMSPTQRRNEFSPLSKSPPTLKAVDYHIDHVHADLRSNDSNLLNSPPVLKKMFSNANSVYSSPKMKNRSYNDLTPSRRSRVSGKYTQYINSNDRNEASYSTKFRPENMKNNESPHTEYSENIKITKHGKVPQVNRNSDQYLKVRDSSYVKGSSNGERNIDAFCAEQLKNERPNFINTPLHHRQARGHFHQNVPDSTLLTAGNDTALTETFCDQSSKTDSGVSTFHEENMGAELLSIKNLKTFNQSFSEKFSFVNVSLDQSECETSGSNKNDDKVRMWLTELKTDPDADLESTMDQKLNGMYSDCRQEYQNSASPDNVFVKFVQQNGENNDVPNDDKYFQNNVCKVGKADVFEEKFSPKTKRQNSLYFHKPADQTNLQKSPRQKLYQKSPRRNLPRQTHFQKLRDENCVDFYFQGAKRPEIPTPVHASTTAKLMFEDRVIKKGARALNVVQTFQMLKNEEIAEAMSKFSTKDKHNPLSYNSPSSKELYTSSGRRKEGLVGKRFAEEFENLENDENNDEIRRNVAPSPAKSRKLEQEHRVSTSSSWRQQNGMIGRESKREMVIDGRGGIYRERENDINRERASKMGRERKIEGGNVMGGEGIYGKGRIGRSDMDRGQIIEMGQEGRIEMDREGRNEMNRGGRNEMIRGRNEVDRNGRSEVSREGRNEACEGRNEMDRDGRSEVCERKRNGIGGEGTEVGKDERSEMRRGGRNEMDRVGKSDMLKKGRSKMSKGRRIVMGGGESGEISREGRHEIERGGRNEVGRDGISKVCRGEIIEMCREGSGEMDRVGREMESEGRINRGERCDVDRGKVSKISREESEAIIKHTGTLRRLKSDQRWVHRSSEDSLNDEVDETHEHMIRESPISQGHQKIYKDKQNTNMTKKSCMSGNGKQSENNDLRASTNQYENVEQYNIRQDEHDGMKEDYFNESGRLRYPCHSVNQSSKSLSKQYTTSVPSPNTRLVSERMESQSQYTCRPVRHNSADINCRYGNSDKDGIVAKQNGTEELVTENGANLSNQPYRETVYYGKVKQNSGDEHGIVRATRMVHDRELDSEKNRNINERCRENYGCFSTERLYRKNEDSHYTKCRRDTETLETGHTNRTDNYIDNRVGRFQNGKMASSSEGRNEFNRIGENENSNHFTKLNGFKINENEMLTPKAGGNRKDFNVIYTENRETMNGSQHVVTNRDKVVAVYEENNSVYEVEMDSPNHHTSRSNNRLEEKYGVIKTPKVSRFQHIAVNEFRSPSLNSNFKDDEYRKIENEFLSPRICRLKKNDHDDGEYFSPSTNMAKLKLNTPNSHSKEMQAKQSLVRTWNRERNEKQQFDEDSTSHIHYQGNNFDNGTLSSKYEMISKQLLPGDDRQWSDHHSEDDGEHDDVNPYFVDDNILQDSVQVGFISLDKLSYSSKQLRVQPLHSKQTQLTNYDPVHHAIAQVSNENTSHKTPTMKIGSDQLNLPNCDHLELRNQFIMNQDRNNEIRPSQRFSGDSSFLSSEVQRTNVEKAEPKMKKSLFPVSADKENNMKVSNNTSNQESLQTGTSGKQLRVIENSKSRQPSSQFENFKVPMSPPVFARPAPKENKYFDRTKLSPNNSRKTNNVVKSGNNVVKSGNIHSANMSNKMSALQFMQSTPIKPGARFILNETISTILGNETEAEHEADEEIVLI